MKPTLKALKEKSTTQQKEFMYMFRSLPTNRRMDNRLREKEERFTHTPNTKRIIMEVAVGKRPNTELLFQPK